MGLSMQERKSVTKALAQQYRKASKKEKGVLLRQFVESTGYNRVYAARLLRNHGRQVEVVPGIRLEGDVRCKRNKRTRPRRRQSTYGPEVTKALKKVWRIMDHLSGKRLAPALPEVVPRLRAWDELDVSEEVAGLLMRISPATIDRLLKPERDKLALKARSTTKPGTLLKHQIPVRTFADWDEKQPGFIEIDLVAHEGGVSSGEYCYTLDITDVATGWCELVAVPNKAQDSVFTALQTARRRLPFPLLGIDSDNGSEFINHQLHRYCEREQITFTRARAFRKNDNCYVEQKNWSIVRRYAAYRRYEGQVACNRLNTLYGHVRESVNYFHPSMKLIAKERDGGRVRRRYDRAKTPYHRVLASPDVAEVLKDELRTWYATLNPAHLKRQIMRQDRELSKLSSRRPHPPAREDEWATQDFAGL